MDFIDFITERDLIDSVNVKPVFISGKVSSGTYYYLNLTPEENSHEVVVCGGCEQCTPDYRIERDGFKFYSIEFVANGRGTLNLRGQRSPLSPGALFCYGPGIPHTIETDPAMPMVKHFVDFSGAGLVAMLARTSLFRGPLFAADLLLTRGLFESLLQTGNRESRHREARCMLLLKQLILHIDETAMPQQEVLSPAWQTYRRCREYMEEHFLSVGSVEAVARACHLDKAWLCRLFQRYADETPHQLLTRLKMARAAELLQNPNMLVRQIADATGYSDPYHFSRVFKRTYGIAPEAFAKTTRRQT